MPPPPDQPQQGLSPLRAYFVDAWKDKTIGCLSYLIGVTIAAFLVTLFFHPWAFYMGGRFTPSRSWEGIGAIRSSTGAQYGLFLHLSYYGARGSDRNLDGYAVLCNPQGRVFKYNVYGWVEHVWLYTEGKHTRLDFWKMKGEAVDTHFHLQGRWQNGALLLEDQGSLGIPFRADGSVHPKGAFNPSPIKNEKAAVIVTKGARFDFDEMCSNSITKQ
jgi:hypothetical protein